MKKWIETEQGRQRDGAKSVRENTCFDVGVRQCGRWEARGERQNTVTLSIWRSKEEEEVKEVKQNWKEVEEVGFSLMRRG